MKQDGWLSTTETAAMIRKVLKEACPGTKFSVRSSKYSMGASITIAWEDGPTTDQIKGLTGIFEGSYFDGSIDYKGSRYHVLDGEPVNIHCDFVFQNRENSEAALTTAIIAAVNEYGPHNIPTVDDFKQGRSMITSPVSNYDGSPFWSWSNIIRRTLEHAEPWCDAPAELEPSPTLKRIQSAGDDGYGQGTTGRVAV